MRDHAVILVLLALASAASCRHATYPHRVPEARVCPDAQSEVARYLAYHEVDRRLRVAHQLSYIERNDLAEKDFADVLMVLVPALRELELKRPVMVSLDPQRNDAVWPGASALTSALGQQTTPFAMPHHGLYNVESERLFSATWKYHPITLVHEMAHALVDQHFNIRRLVAMASHNTDVRLAQQALIEGDAMLVTIAFLERGCQPLAVLEMDADSTMKLLDRLELQWVPPESWGLQMRIQENAFRYLGGLQFARTMTRLGGWEQLNSTYRRMPASTEQILHPDKYLQGRDPPIEISVSMPASIPGDGYQLAEMDVVGELRIRALLRNDAEAAAGWGGDTYLLFRKPGRPAAIIWYSTWDTQEDAEQFTAAYRRLTADRPEAGFGRVKRQGQDVLIVSGLPAEVSDNLSSLLSVEKRAAAPLTDPNDSAVAIGGPACGEGEGEGELSVMTLGSTGCRVTVNGEEIGQAPFFRRPAPAGGCPVAISCADGRAFETQLQLEDHRETRLIVHPTDWR